MAEELRGAVDLPLPRDPRWEVDGGGAAGGSEDVEGPLPAASALEDTAAAAASGEIPSERLRGEMGTRMMTRARSDQGAIRMSEIRSW